MTAGMVDQLLILKENEEEKTTFQTFMKALDVTRLVDSSIDKVSLDRDNNSDTSTCPFVAKHLHLPLISITISRLEKNVGPVGTMSRPNNDNSRTERK